MFTRSLTQYATGIAVLLALLMACGGGGDINFSTENPGFDGFDNWPWPDNPDFTAEADFSRDVQVAAHVRLQLQTINGDITITGQPDATSVRVTAVLRVGSNVSQNDAEEGLDQLDVVVTDQAEEILIQTQQPQASQGRQYIVNYTITLPSDLEVDIDQVNGDILVEEMANSVSATLVYGNIDSTVRLPLNGEIWLSTAKGNLDLSIPRSTSAELSAFVDHGTITWNDLDLIGTVHTNRSLTGTLGGAAGVIRLESTNGNIDLIGFDG